MAEARQPKTVRVEGLAVFRYSNYDTPFWARPNTTAGRWHSANDGPTQYLSLHSDAAWADLIRRENLRRAEDVDLIRIPIWVALVSQQNIVDYSRFAEADAAGFRADALVDDDHEQCRAEGSRLRALGYAGVLSHSPALPGELNLTLFGRRILSTWNATSRLASELPACVVAKGAPPDGVLERVRFAGEPHAGLIEYGRQRARSRRSPKTPRNSE